MCARAFIAVFVIFLCSCATPGRFERSHNHPSSYYVVNEKHVSTSADEVWDVLVRELSKSFFIINNIDKASRIINVSFYTENAEKYADCGHTHIETDITIPPPNTIHKTYDYKTCEDSYFVVGGSFKNNFGAEFPTITKVDRKTSLDGRMNIYIAPDETGTLITVNCRFTFNVEVDMDLSVYNLSGGLIRNDSKTGSQSCTFDSKRPGKSTWGSGEHRTEIKCSSMGVLERKILSLIKLQ